MRFIVYRQEKLEPSPIVLVTATVSSEIRTHSQLLDALRAGISEWVQSTHDGKEIYECTGNDMNIGDMYEWVEEILLYCKDIYSLSFEFLSSSPDWTYDTSLCNPIELGEK